MRLHPSCSVISTEHPFARLEAVTVALPEPFVPALRDGLVALQDDAFGHAEALTVIERTIATWPYAEHVALAAVAKAIVLRMQAADVAKTQHAIDQALAHIDAAFADEATCAFGIGSGLFALVECEPSAEWVGLIRRWLTPVAPLDAPLRALVAALDVP